jgi:hypothetical protein
MECRSDQAGRQVFPAAARGGARLPRAEWRHGLNAGIRQRYPQGPSIRRVRKWPQAVDLPTVVIVNMAGFALVAVALGLAMTAGRRTRWGRPGVRWLLAACLVIFGAELVNLYTLAPWGSFLFYLSVPFWAVAVIVEVRAWRREGRERADGEDAGGEGAPGRVPAGDRREAGGQAPDETWQEPGRRQPPGHEPPWQEPAPWQAGPQQRRPPPQRQPGPPRQPRPGGEPPWYR